MRKRSREASQNGATKRKEILGRGEIAAGGGVRRSEAAGALLGAAALAVVGPLRGALETLPLILFLGTLVLFMAPGMLLSRRFLGEQFPGAASLPVSFAISAGLFALLGVPMLVLHVSLGVYLWVAGAIVATSLTWAAFGLLRGRTPAGSGAEAGSYSFDPLWAPFVLSGAVLAFVSRSRVPTSYDDLWVYLAHVREFLHTDHLALYEPYFGNETGLSRIRISGWLLQQAALSRVSGIDPIELVLHYLAPTLVVVGLLAFYALSRVLFESESAALLAGCVCALFFLVNLDASLLSFGGEFVGRVAEDKFATRYIFLPVALALAVAFVKSRRPRYVAVFALVCWATMAVHPVGLAVIGLSVAGFGLLYLGVNWRGREAWVMVAGLGGTLLSAVAVPAAVLFLATGEALTAVLSDADINSGDPDVLANMVFVRPERQRILELDNGSYIMHPSLLTDPVVLGALLLGTPFLLRRLTRSPAAQMLLGVLFAVTIVCYVPQIATFMGDRVVLPGQLWRLAWPLPLAALLIAGWMAWEAAGRAEAALAGLGIAPRLTRFLPALLVGASMLACAPAVAAGAESVDRSEEVARSPRSCSDPVFGWMRSNLKEPSVVLAPDAENTCIPAYTTSANVVSLRGGSVLGVLPALERRVPGEIEVPRGALDVRRFFSGPGLAEAIEILRRHEVDYVLVPRGTDSEALVASLPGTTAVETPGERYSLYAVERRNLPGQGRDQAGAQHYYRPVLYGREASGKLQAP